MDRLNDAQLDTALTDVERSDAGVHTYSNGPFSVFRIDHEPNKRVESPEEGLVSGAPDLNEQSPLDPLPDGLLPLLGPELEFTPETIHLEEIENNNGLSSQAEHSPNFASPEMGGWSLVFQTDAQRSGGLAAEAGLNNQSGIESEAPVEQSLAIEKEAGAMPLEGQGQYTRQDQVAATDLGTSRFLFNPTFLTVQIRLLLDHYCQHVLPIFSILENGNTPWRHLHLARSFQCSSELEITGTSTSARKALLYAVLACSAYNLHNRYLCQEQGDTLACWARVAFDHRLQAVKCLRESAAARDVASTNAEYKELLAAMLSMVTIDVISGDTRTCGTHLNGCESLIFAYQSRPSKSRKFSHAVRALHRIFFFLRSMQDGTLHMCDVAPNEIPNENSQVVITQGEPKGRSDALLKELESILAIDEHRGEPVSSSCELIYGVPPKLLALLRRACRLLPQRERDVTSSNLMAACEQLEEDILEWPINDAVRHVDSWPLSAGNKLILQHHMRAFHQAIIIFFCRRVQRMHRRHVQQYVKTVIYHLKEIERIKQEQHIWAGPVLWPAFVAALEAISQDTEAEILQWFELIEKHGVGTARRTREALQKLWQGKGSINLYPTSADSFETPLIMT